MRSFWDIFKKFDPHVAKKDYAEMMLACAIYDDKEPQVWYGTGPATCNAPTVNVPLSPEGTTI